MSDKKIVFSMYAVTSAIGFYLVFDVGGAIGTTAGVLMILFAGMGLAGMARFG